MNNINNDEKKKRGEGRGKSGQNLDRQTLFYVSCFMVNIEQLKFDHSTIDNFIVHKIKETKFIAHKIKSTKNFNVISCYPIRYSQLLSFKMSFLNLFVVYPCLD